MSSAATRPPLADLVKPSVLVLLLVCGCEEILGRPADLGRAPDLPLDASAPTLIRGQTCVLAELRDHRLCSPGHPHGPVTVGLASGSPSTTTVQGHFTLELPPGPPQVLVRAIDPRRQLKDALVQLVRNGPPTAIPMVPAERLEPLRALGLPLDPSRGALLAYVVDPEGRPMRGVRVQVVAQDGRFQGPLFEDGLEVLQRGQQTGPGGLVALFELLPGSVTLHLSGPRQASYTLAVAADAVTFSLLR